MPRGTVKFFNGGKGFGFITPEEGGADVFVHVSGLYGVDTLSEGDEVTFDLEPDQRSGKVAAVDVQVTRAVRAAGGRGRFAPRSGRSERSRDPGGAGGVERSHDGEPGSGVVKWFNSAKGFGFIQPDDGGPDVFVHISAVERAGISGLNDGQSVRYDLQQDRRTGKMAASNLRLG